MAKIKKLIPRAEPYNGEISLNNFINSFKEDCKGFRCENLKVSLLEDNKDTVLSMEGKMYTIPLKKPKNKKPTLSDIYNLLSVVVNDVAKLKSDVEDLKSDMVEVKDDIRILKSDMVKVKKDISLIKQCPTIKKELSEIDSNDDDK